MNDKKLPLVARLALKLKWVTQEQLASVVEELDSGQPAEDFLVTQGFITERQQRRLESLKRELLAKHRDRRAAEGAQSDPATSLPKGSPHLEKSKKADVIHALASRSAEELAPVTEGTPNGSDSVAEPGQRLRSSDTEVADPICTPESKTTEDLASASMKRPSFEATAESVGLGLSFRSDHPEPCDALDEILQKALEAGASDVHLHAEGYLALRVGGELIADQTRHLNAETAERLVVSALTDVQREELRRFGELDFCLQRQGVGRFRANAYRQQRGFDLVLRSIPSVPPTLEELGLPADLEHLTDFHQGMVLLTGPAGCGKSATLAALVNLINENRQEHILTVEDPIEVLHPSKGCLVNQRHAGRHTQSFGRALRGALREDPDVIVIGELRDLETISLAMTAAETGHFVLATLHTNNAVRTINRLIGAFPSGEQAQVRAMLSVSLRAVVSQRLVPRVDGSGRLPALEVLRINKAIGNLIRDEKTIQIRSAMQTGRNQGMYLLEQSLNERVEAGQISRESALKLAEEKKLITAGL
ncbi:MAG: PilT/PilU family type 4a pilus ATPase [Myxococcota bacterium]|nr:PilT/PilU family type 4a pilus ATPase [Myxococcota bacterium]